VNILHQKIFPAGEHLQTVLVVVPLQKEEEFESIYDKLEDTEKSKKHIESLTVKHQRLQPQSRQQEGNQIQPSQKRQDHKGNDKEQQQQHQQLIDHDHDHDNTQKNNKFIRCL